MRSFAVTPFFCRDEFIQGSVETLLGGFLQAAC
jgi:hypothetical protein